MILSILVVSISGIEIFIGFRTMDAHNTYALTVFEQVFDAFIIMFLSPDFGKKAHTKGYE